MITKKELANAYCIHRHTLTKRITNLGINKKARLSPKDLIIIFEELGTPDHFVIQHKKMFSVDI